MLKKDDMKPGTKVRIKVLKDGVPCSGDFNAENCVSIFTFKNGQMGFWSQLHVGDQLLILQGPKKVGPEHRINAVNVKLVGKKVVGFIYWCSLRASGELI